MTTRTETELATAVLREMGVVDAEETPATVDITWVTSCYEDKFAELQSPGLELTYWLKTNIPQAVFNLLRDLIINEVQGSYGDPLPPDVKEQREILILKKLRRHVSVPSAGVPTMAEYF